MNVMYTGKLDALSEGHRKKVEDRFAKLAKLLDMRRGEREAHVVINNERHLINAEITVRFHDHQLVGIGSAPEIFPAISAAQDKLEKQVMRIKERLITGKRAPREEIVGEETRLPAGLVEGEAPEEISSEAVPGRTIFRIDHHERRKPMTLDEALLEIERGRNYVVYKDADTDRTSVLVRRRDGNFDLIEA